MMAFIWVGISGHLAFWLLRSRVGVLMRLANDSVRLVDGMLQPGDEDEKMEALEAQTARVLGALLLFFFWVGVALLVMVSLPCFWDWVQGRSADLGVFWTWQGLVALSVGGTLGLIYPKGKGHSGAYSPMNQLLHRLALDNPNLHRKLHEREVKKWRKQGGTRDDGFVLVTGLARAGTTSLMQRLMETGGYSSLNYANMPFVMAPGTWRRFFRPKTGALKERSHGDGILVGADSAEALEEPFFRVMTADTYINEDALVAHQVTAKLHAAYLDQQGLVREAGKTYLAKNNNALLRYAGLREHNRTFWAVLMFREPLAHAASLLAMHKRYSSMQTEDPFVKTYMDWLVHHEFGLGHKPFRFDEATQGVEGDPLSLDYWLDRWLDYYNHALTVDGHRLVFVSHEVWSQQPGMVLQAVMDAVGVQGAMPQMQPHQRSRKTDAVASPDRLAAATALYGRLMERALHLD